MITFSGSIGTKIFKLVSAVIHVQTLLTRILFRGIFFLSCLGCATIIRPKGDWTRPVDLDLTKGVLAGSRIGLECGQRNRETQEWQAAGGRICGWMQRALEPTGADVRVLDEFEVEGEGIAFGDFDGALVTDSASLDTGKEMGKSNTVGVSKPWQPDFTIRFVEVESKRTIQWGMELMFITMSFIPYTVVTESSAEVQILDEAGRLSYREQLRMDELRAYGLGAVLYYLSPRESDDVNIARALTQHLQNLAYSYRLITDRKQLRLRTIVDKE